ncbi:hypothetical protein KKP04_13615 [Rhodomicrobium sp. Az07]|uniref:hypothetical protein n=1 Tax=Rhodomicrobium sp. Az07 TaxID=2839034 RepID=UPI001BEC5B78|nr:hypothetical protein [Rhodomicrobium sp. Az07]MBT3071901.1 hypothetical protein [Rhodomicrobium sp. Az07]
MSEVDTRISPSLHPSNMASVEGYDDSTAHCVAQIESAFTTTYETLRKVHNAREKAKTNPTWNEAQQIVNTADFADKVMLDATRAIDTALANMKKGIASHEAKLAQPIASRSSSVVAVEIRSHLQKLSSEDRRKLIRAAIKAGDAETMSSVLGAPAYLSGLNPEMQTAYTREWNASQSPDVFKQLTVMQGAYGLLSERSALFWGEMQKAVGAPWEKVNELRTAKNKAEKAFAL